MALINSLSALPDDVEERMALRDEFTRRGLNEIMTVRSITFTSSLHEKADFVTDAKIYGSPG